MNRTSIDLLEKWSDKKKGQTDRQTNRENLADLDLGRDPVFDS